MSHEIKTDAIENVLRKVFWSDYHDGVRRLVEITADEHTAAFRQLVAVNEQLAALRETSGC